MSLTNLLVGVASNLATLPGVAAVLIVYLIYLWLSQKKYKLPPGPPGLPLLGNLLDFKAEGTTLTNKTMEWRKKYGDVFQYKMGLSRWVVIGSIETLNEAYLQRGHDFANKPFVPSLYRISSGGNNIAFAPYSEALRYRRKVAMQAMRQYLTGSIHTERVHQVILTSISNMVSQKGSFNPHRFISHIIFNLIHDLCFGYSRDIDDPTYTKMLSFLDSTNLQLTGFWEDIFPVLLHCPTRKFRQVMATMQEFIDYMQRHLDESKDNFDKENMKTLIDHILLAHKVVAEGEDEALKTGFTDIHILQIIRDVFFAGINTSRHSLEWVILVLAVNQKVQNKMHEEIDRVTGGAVPCREHRPGLVYTEAAIQEVMRLFPAAPMALPHATMCDTQVGGYEIPAKTNVLVHQYAIMRDPRHWDDAEVFKPERFIDDSGSKVKARPQSWIPFSIGSRSCVGEFLARQNILYCVVGLFQQLHFDPAPEMGQPDLTPANMWLDLRPRPYKVVVTRRNR